MSRRIDRVHEQVPGALSGLLARMFNRDVRLDELA
jgi:hypothetical protein